MANFLSDPACCNAAFGVNTAQPSITSLGLAATSGEQRAIGAADVIPRRHRSIGPAKLDRWTDLLAITDRLRLRRRCSFR